jgi:hypothetical protein
MSLSSGRSRASERSASFLGDSLPVLRGHGVSIVVRHCCVHGRGLPNGRAGLGHGATIFDTSSSSIGSYHWVSLLVGPPLVLGVSSFWLGHRGACGDGLCRCLVF